MWQESKKQKVSENKKALAEGSASPKESIVMHAGASRNELMLQAKAKGIKNFRLLNKEELAEILKEDTTQERINEIISGAVARWKAGWGKGKKQRSKES